VEVRRCRVMRLVHVCVCVCVEREANMEVISFFRPLKKRRKRKAHLVDKGALSLSRNLHRVLHPQLSSWKGDTHVPCSSNNNNNKNSEWLRWLLL
jgi:hypothetical protein